MHRSLLSSFKSFALNTLYRQQLAYCDELTDQIEQADAVVEALKKGQTMTYDNLKTMFVGQSAVNTFDGLRVGVQRQLGMNAVVTHFYWTGSDQLSAGGGPKHLYQYRLIYSDDEKPFINVATDVDFNIDGEVKYALTPSLLSKVNWTQSDLRNKSLSGELHYTGSDFNTQAKFTKESGNAVNIAYMQSVTPSFQLGGALNVDFKGPTTCSFAGFYDAGEYNIGGVWEDKLQLLLVRKVNPNRVTVMTNLEIDGSLQSTAGVTAEYSLKQSKLNFSLDSNLVLRSMLETSLTPGVSLQMCGEVAYLKDYFKFGTGMTFN